VQQIAYAYESEIHEYVAEEERKGIKIGVSREQWSIPCAAHTMAEIKIARFSMSNGIGVVALDATDVAKLFPNGKFHSLTRAFVEVRLSICLLCIGG
jgi:hypothetical protein